MDKKKMHQILLVAIFTAMASGSSATDVDDLYVEVDLSQGKLQGVRQTLGGSRGERHSTGDSRVYYSFRGIPYAEPPVGKLRFKDPVPARPWQGLRKDMEPPSCPQAAVEASMQDSKEIIGEEDCLYLNVYTPKPYKSDLPVMVYFHGGGFKLGNSDFMGGTPHRLLTKDVILVSIHYRLGTLGFLSTGDSILPGNYGLKDQTLALRWVHDNIQVLGGDIHKVTIFGESAGAASVHFQILSPYAKGLFKRAILQSGTSLNPWALRDDHAEIALQIGKSLGYPKEKNSPINSVRLLYHLQEASVEELVKAPVPYTSNGLPFLMVPRVDGDFIPGHPAKLLRDGKYHKVDLISGVTRNEAAGIVKSMMISNQTTDPAFMESFISNTISVLTGLDSKDNNQYFNRRAFYNYLFDFFIREEDVNQFEKFITEAFMVMSQDESAALHARDAHYGQQVYRYELQHRGRRSFADWANTSYGKDWVAHIDDLQYLFDDVLGYPALQHPPDIFLSDVMIALWTNFAKTGNPTPDLELGFKWEPMTSPTDFRFLALTLSPEMKEDYRKENRVFWRNMPLKRNQLLFPNCNYCTQQYSDDEFCRK